MSKKTIAFAMLIMLFIITSCQKNIDEISVSNTMSQFFENHDSYDEFINKPEIINSIKDNPFGAVGTSLSYATEKYAIIQHFNGIIIYDIKNECISSTIDIKGLEVGISQGADALEIIGNNEYIYIYQISNDDIGYLYSLDLNELNKVDNFAKEDYFNEKREISDDITNTIKSEILMPDDLDFFDVFRTNENLIIFTNNPNEVDSWKILVLDNELKILSESYLF